MTLEFKSIPLKHQAEGLARGKDAEFYAYICDMGTGKSALLLYNVAYLWRQKAIKGLIIVCPKSVMRTWSDAQIPTHLPDDLSPRIVVWGSESKALDRQLTHLFDKTQLGLPILIINADASITNRGYGAMAKFLELYPSMMAVDESTSIKSVKAARTKILTKLGKKASYRRILTGTPVANSPIDVFAQFNFLKDGCLGFTSWLAFRNRYAVTVTRYINGRRFAEIIGWQRLDELASAVGKYSFRVLKQDCLDLPPKVYQKRYIELAPEQQKYYKDMRELALAELAGGDLVAAPLVITRILRLRQSLCNIYPADDGKIGFISKSDARLNEVLNIVDEAGDQKILVWTCFVEPLKQLTRAINDQHGDGTAASFYGEVPEKERQRLIDEFQSNGSKLKVLVLNQATGGEGITLTKATLVIYHSNDWSLRMRQQSEDRCHRIGQNFPCCYIDIVAQGTLDEDIVNALQNKQDLAQAVTGDALRKLLLQSQ
jgi:SNF2 family DNA or RNA helicase